MNPSVEYLVTVLGTEPLTVHVSLHNSVDAARPVLVPVLLIPLGAFVKAAVLDGRGEVVWQSSEPKISLKLHPDRRESYLALEPGYSHGVVFRLEGVPVPSGPYELRVSYSNGPYTGPRDQPVGVLAFHSTLPFVRD